MRAIELPNQRHRRSVLQLLLAISAVFGFFLASLIGRIM
jgi:hypothetical protein